MAKVSKTQLANQVRDKYLLMFQNYLTEQVGEEVLRIAGNAIGFPTLDAEGNEIAVKIVISVPRGSRLDGEDFDVYGEAEKYKMEQEKKAARAEEEARKKAEAAKKREEKKAEHMRKKEAEAAKAE